MIGEKCQVCGGKVVNGRCSLCGMPYRNDEVLYHLNEPREVHYRHASAKVRDMMRQYSQTVDKTTQRSGRVNRSANTGRNRTKVLNQGKKQQKEGRKRSSMSWIIWLIVALVALFPQIWDYITEWISMNL